MLHVLLILASCCAESTSCGLCLVHPLRVSFHASRPPLIWGMRWKGSSCYASRAVSGGHGQSTWRLHIDRPRGVMCCSSRPAVSVCAGLVACARMSGTL